MSSKRSARLLVSARSHLPWRRYLLDSGLALVGVLLVTGGIAFFQLYPRISTISLSYLLVVLALAALRGRVAAILASLLAFFAFNFFLVPPLYTFVVGRLDDLVALFVFLATAIITGQLASALRSRAEVARRREEETHILYELGRAVNSEDDLTGQLTTVTQAVVNVFSSWGVRDCALLLPDAGGTLRVQATGERDAHGPLEQVRISSEEQAAAAWVMQHRQTVDVYDNSLAAHWAGPTAPQIVVRASPQLTTQFVRLVPLLSNDEAIGVLRLVIEGASLGSETARTLGADRHQPGSTTTFFWTLVDQITFLIVQVRLRGARLHIQALQETDALRAALLSSVSHDLRTPLATMKAATSSLLAEDIQWDEESRRSFLLSIERELDRLNRLVSNLLDLSRIEGNALKPNKEWYLIDELIRDGLDRLQPLLHDRAVQLRVLDTVPPVELDYLAIDQVLTNLIENAVAYTPVGSPIEISVQQIDDQVQFCVADRGPGIPAADLERIFDKFYRVLDKGREKPRHGGSGLGLTVCRGLVEAHGGRIWAANRADGGAIFSVSLPTGTKKAIPEPGKDVTNG
jgi:two-component system sensor histidine kinase KdpD